MWLIRIHRKQTQTHLRRPVQGPCVEKCFSTVSCSNVALRIVKLRREDFKQTGSSTFEIGWELRSPQSIECNAFQQHNHLLHHINVATTDSNIPRWRLTDYISFQIFSHLAATVWSVVREISIPRKSPAKSVSSTRIWSKIFGRN